MTTKNEIDNKPKKELDYPRLPTVKRLYAVSGNQCAFTGCAEPLVDGTLGVVTSDICHIKASSEKGPRHDKDQSPEDRHGFDNLMLLCGRHHDIIDKDEKTYSVETLIDMKKAHEAMVFGEPVSEDADEVSAVLFTQQVVNSYAANFENNSVVNGSLINAPGLSGSQAAHTIINQGTSPQAIFKAQILMVKAEREYESIKRIWSGICTLTNSTQTLRQLYDRRENTDRQEIKRKYHLEAEAALFKAQQFAADVAPFIPKEISDLSFDLIAICNREINYFLGAIIAEETKDKSYSAERAAKEAIQGAFKVSAAFDELETYIRARIESLGLTSSPNSGNE